MRGFTGMLTLTAVLLVTGCGSGDGDITSSPTRTGTPPVSPPVTESPAPATSGPVATSGPTTRPGWSTGPVVREREIPVPPVPLLIGIRAAAHPGFDRIVFDFRGQLPGYDIRYVSRVIKDPSGELANVPGRRFLLIRFQPTDAHDTAGRPTAPRGATVNLPMLRAYQVVGDFEAVVTVALGLDDTVGFRAGELPGRIYVDIAA